MRIVPAEVADAEALTDLHLDVWEQAYADLMPTAIFRERRAGRARRIEQWHAILTAASSTNLLAWGDHGHLLGFASTGPGRDEPRTELPGLELMALYVRAEVYGGGVGYALCEAAIGSSPAYLWVLDGNERAIRFYERQGFGFDAATKPEEVGLERRMVRR